jgi:hypothetical protein
MYTCDICYLSAHDVEWDIHDVALFVIHYMYQNAINLWFEIMHLLVDNRNDKLEFK